MLRACNQNQISTKIMNGNNNPSMTDFTKHKIYNFWKEKTTIESNNTDEFCLGFFHRKQKNMKKRLS